MWSKIIPDSLRFSQPAYFVLFYAVCIATVIFAGVLALKIIYRPSPSKYSKYKWLGEDAFWLSVLAICLLSVTALAGPKLAGMFMLSVDNNVDIIFGVDDSASMRADDVKPSRQEAAKKIIVDLASSGAIGPGDRVALFRFASSSNWRMPLSRDLDDLKAKVAEIEHPKVYEDESQLDTDLVKVLEHIPQSMDKEDNVFSKTLKKFGVPWQKNNRIVILLTDGHDQVGDSAAAAVRELKKRGIKVYAVGIGTRADRNITIHAYDPDYPAKIDEIVIRVALEEKELINVARATGGEYRAFTDGNIQSFLKGAIRSNRYSVPHLVRSGNDKNVWWDVLAVPSLVLLLLAIAAVKF